MRKFRQLHLWIGLLTSVFILMEAVTGLLLSEPWMMGQTSRSEIRMPAQTQQAAGTATPDRQDPASGSSASSAPAQEGKGNNQGAASSSASGQQGRAMNGSGQQGTSFVGLIHGLHEGRIGSTDVKWLADVTAIGLIVLTITGISLSVQTLRAQSRSRRKRAAA